MKKLIIITLFSLTACIHHAPEKKYDYSVVNKSGVTLEVIPYTDDVKQILDKVILQNNQIFNKKVTDYAPYTGGLSMPSLFIKKALSEVTQVEFIFDYSKKVIYGNCFKTSNRSTQPRNIFNTDFNDELIEVYTITPEDFQNAIDCGGNCN